MCLANYLAHLEMRCVVLEGVQKTTALIGGLIIDEVRVDLFVMKWYSVNTGTENMI